MKKLTAVALPTLPEGEHPDPLTPGLIFRPGKRRKPWLIRYRKGGKRHAEIIGYYPKLGLADARTLAGEMLKRVEAGQSAQPVAVLHPQSSKVLTVEKVIDLYEKARRLKGKRIKNLDEALRTVRTNLADHLKTPAKEFSKGDLRKVRDAIGERGATIMSNRFLGYFGPIWRWACAEEKIDHNFVPELLRIGEEAKRERILDHDEIRAVWNATLSTDDADNASERSFGRLVRFLLLVGQRKENGVFLHHGDILDGNWKQDFNKSSRPLLLKLPKLVLGIIGKGEAGKLVFGGEEGQPLDNFDRRKNALLKLSGTAGWTLHDLRRTCSSGLQDLGYDELLIKRCLNHKIGGLSEVYLRSTLDPQRAAAFAAWAKQIEKIVGKRGPAKQSDNVRRLPTRGKRAA